MNKPSKTKFVHVIYIRTTPRALWNALTQAKFTRQYYAGLELDAEPMGMVCKLTVTHDEFPEGGPTLETVREGWPEILSSLKSLLETGQALVIPRNP